MSDYYDPDDVVFWGVIIVALFVFIAATFCIIMETFMKSFNMEMEK